MKDIIPSFGSPLGTHDAYSGTHRTAQVIDIQEEKKLEGEALALVELHDFIKAHPDTPVKEIAKFMPPVDSRAVSKAIKMLAMREATLTPEQRASRAKIETERTSSIEVGPRVGKWGK